MSDIRIELSVMTTLQQQFINAAKAGNLEVVKLLLTDNRVDPSDDDNLAIIWAASRGHHEVVKTLLADNRVDPSC